MSNNNLTKDFNHFITDFIGGGVSAVMAKTLIAPIDRVKTLLQCQDVILSLETGKTKKYKGIRDCVIRIPKEQGLISFWRGNFVNCIRYFPTQALNFALKDLFHSYLLPLYKKGGNCRILSNFISGGAAGGLSLSIVFPLDFVKQRLASDIGKEVQDREFTGMFNCLRKIVNSDGILGLYRGFCISVVRMIAYRAIYFGTYDSIKETVFKDFRQANSLYLYLFAQFSTNLSSLISYPLDTIRRRMMMMSGRKDKLFVSAAGCLRHIIAKEGAAALYKGALSNIFKGMGGAIVLVLYDKRQVLIGYNP